jgi:hypothetical protein
MPRQVSGDQPFDIGVDGELCGIESGRSDHQQHTGNDHAPPVPGAKINNSNDRCIQHGKRKLRRGPTIARGAPTLEPVKSFSSLNKIRRVGFKALGIFIRSSQAT